MLTTFRSFASQLLAALRAHGERRRVIATLRELDAHTLADIGIDPSEISSIEAEWAGRSKLTRRRIASSQLRHA